MAPAVRFEGFSWRPLGRRAPTVDSLDLAIGPGERVLLVGPSGSGKSTMLHAIAGALGTTLPGEVGGVVEVSGRVGLVMQSPVDSVVAERVGRDVAFGPENLGLPREEIWRRVDRALADAGLAFARDRPTRALSGGEQQRLALAGALATRPDVLLLDEPTSMLDDASAARVRDAVARTAGDRTLVVVEHRFAPWLPLVDRVVALGPSARVEFDGPVERFLAAPDRDGLWMPGRPAPEPVAIDPVLVRPRSAERVAASGVSVTLTSRSLRGRLTGVALRDFDADLAPGAATAISGPSGSGKSTALLALAGLVRPSAGRIAPDLSRLRSRALARRVGWVPQNPALGFLCDTVGEEVTRTSRALGESVDPLPLLDLIALAPYAATHPLRLSGGEQRRLAQVAALAHRPGLALLDEPTVGQDPQAWAVMTGWYASAAAAGATVAFSTHDAQAPRDREIEVRR